MKKKLFLMIALLCAVVQGAWAQASLDEVYAMTNTTAANWTQLSAGSTTGKTLGTANATTYYYADANLSFTNSMAGGSGLTILGTVYLYVPQGVTVTCTGANANGATGGGAGIELTAGNFLNLLGSGSVNATGGNAANGGNGGNGNNAECTYDESILGGSGGTGGNGGGGAGAGIGTCGGNGGTGGTGGQRNGSYGQETTQYGVDGNAGSGGSTAGPMGTLYKTNDITVNATGGSAGSNGTGGNRGLTASQHPGSNVYMASGGGGGGAGGFGGAATGIGTGGPGGGGGGGGAAGNVAWVVYSGTDNGYYHAGAFGGNGGKNADGSSAPNGADVELTNPKYADIQAGGLRDNASDYSDDDGWENGNGRHAGGSGGAAGSASTSESAVIVSVKMPEQSEWDMACRMTNTSRSGWTALPLGGSKGITIGTAGQTTYYFASGDRTFTNSAAGGSGLTILGTVYLFISSGQTITCTGANAGGATGAGAGVELTAGNTLYLIGSGTMNATGGNAASGGNGQNGDDAYLISNNTILGGSGGRGGDGGGGAGAGIGTRGGNGGSGGSGGQRTGKTGDETKQYGVDGEDANSAGCTAGAMGVLYVANDFTLTAKGGSAGSSGTGGLGGKTASQHPGSNLYLAAGGGGGGAGGFGGAASHIGTGGPGGGGGGGGAAGSVSYNDFYSGTTNGYYNVGAYGGKGGKNANGSSASNGADVELTNPKYADIQGTGLRDKAEDYTDANGWVEGYRHAGGSGSDCGSASIGGSAITLKFDWTDQENDWDKICFQTKTTQADWTLLTEVSNMGKTLGKAGTTTYYYTMMDRTFTNITPGGSGLTIQGTVYLYIPARLQITCTGADASGATCGGAGIELTEGNTLYLIGDGKLVATGGNAANGSNGGNGGDASFTELKWVRSGDGGRGGDGGGGAGAGIGTRGGNGGTGGAGGAGIQSDFEETTGNAGSNGAAGGIAADMGTLYIYDMSAPTTEIHGGSTGTRGGNGGAGGLHGLDLEATVYIRYGWSTGGGGGGGAGGFGGAASDIGTGGPGGGGGGGGASGSIQSCYSENPEVDYKVYFFYQVGALGGSAGANADGTLAADGQSTLLDQDDDSLLAQKDESTAKYENQGWQKGDNRAAGGTGGGTGSATIPGSANLADVELPLQGSGTEGDPYIISSTEHWDTFVSIVNSGYNFRSRYVRLDANINVTTPVGSRVSDSDNRPFSGIFLGNNKTITAAITDNSNQGTAPFRYIDGATIKGLTVAGSIDSNQPHMAGLAGFADGENLIEGCAVKATLNISTDYAGGIIGHGLSSETTIRGCVFAGTMNAVGSNNPNVGVIWGWSDSATPTLENSLEAGTYTGISKLHPMGLQKATGTIEGCYYMTPQIGWPSNACTVSGAKQAYALTPDNYGDLVQDYGVLAAYASGILYNRTFYGTSITITLADNSNNSSTISYNNGTLADVTIDGRTLYRDGGWNTLCLPFSLDSFDGTPLARATVRTLASTSFKGGTLTMNFSDAVSSIEAGKPYIVKWEYNVVDLSTLTANYTAQDGETLTGTLGGNYKISIADGATVKLQNVTINGENTTKYTWAGISCSGDATIFLKGTNTVRGFSENNSGIYVPSGSTLTIKGSGSLNASSNGYGAGIGGGYMKHCGNIVIEGGTINATGGEYAAGIGGGYQTSCGTITITDGVTKVTATKGNSAPNSIGAGGDRSTCGTVTVGGVEGAIVNNHTYTGTGSGSVDVVSILPDFMNPVFSGVIISNAPANVETDYVDFVGTYSPVGIYTDEKTNLYLGDGNTLYYPTASNFKVNAFRGYFQLKQGLTAGDPNAGVRAFVLNFDEGSGESTGIISVDGAEGTVNGSDMWYTLDGRKLQGKPTQRGIYINNGRKVVIK